MIKYSLTLCVLFFVSSSFAQPKEEKPPVAIYGNDTVIWFGADFSLFRLSNPKKMEQDEKLYEYIYAWNLEYKNTISNVKLASWLKAKKVVNDKDFTDSAYESYLTSNWIIEDKHEITLDEIEEHLKNYTSENSGIGLTFILENFKKEPSGPGATSKVHGYFIWFDIDSKKIIHSSKISGHPSTAHFNPSGGWVIGKDKKMPKNKGMTGYWFQGMVDATIKFSIEYKNGIEKEEVQY
jgi:hypothetical protein